MLGIEYRFGARVSLKGPKRTGFHSYSHFLAAEFPEPPWMAGLPRLQSCAQGPSVPLEFANFAPDAPENGFGRAKNRKAGLSGPSDPRERPNGRNSLI